MEKEYYWMKGLRYSTEDFYEEYKHSLNKDFYSL
jgi:hypothetical protein